MSVRAFNQSIKLLESANFEMDVCRPVSGDDIRLCEQKIGFKLPKSYQVFLSEYGFGGSESIEFCGLIAGDLEKDSYVNAYAFTQGLQKDHDLPNELFAFENFDGDAVACLMLSQMKDGECPVILWDHSEDQIKQLNAPHVIADGFGLYFLKKVKELLEDEGLA